MELLRLDNNFQADMVIENFDSLVWAERYSANGDFKLVSNNIAETMAALPLPKTLTSPETYVSLRDSTVPMVVEWHKIIKSDAGIPQLEVTGRTLEASALERRVSVKEAMGQVRKVWTISAVKESDAAYETLRVILGDVARSKDGVVVLPAISPAVSANDAIPEITLTLPSDYGTVIWSAAITYSPGEVVFHSGTYYISSNLASNINKPPASSPTFWSVLSTPAAWDPAVTYGPNRIVLYSGVLYLSSGKAGNLNQIPSTPSSTYWSAVTAGFTYEIKPGNLYPTVMELIQTNHHGIKSVRPNATSTKVGVEIYNGADLRETIVFDARFDQFEGATYLLGQQGSANVTYVYSKTTSQQVLKTAAPEPSGMFRRVLLTDLTEMTNVSDTPETRSSQGLINLYQYNATSLFDGQVANQIANGYNTAYFLGDIIRLTGEYGLTEDVRIAEFIRTSDADGEKSYPTFEAVVT